MKIKLKRASILFLSILMTMCVAFSTISALASGSVQWENIIINEYNLGNEFNVPSRNVTVNGQTYSAKATVIFPSGKATSENVISFDQAGRYAIQYSVEVNGFPYIKTEYIDIKHDAYSYLDENTVAKSLNIGDYNLSPNATGSFISIQPNDTVTMQQTIEVPNDNDDILLTKFFVAPKSRGVSEMKILIFRFADAYDPESFFEVRFNGNYYEDRSNFVYGGSYVLARGANQTMKAYSSVENKLYGEGGYGNYVYGGFYAMDYNKTAVDPMDYHLGIYFNPVTCSISVGDCFGSSGTIKNVVKIIDTNDVTHQGAGNPLWNGFDSGKVIMSIYAENYIASTANLVLLDVKDTDLNKDIIIDEEGPMITVESYYDHQNMPEARVGEDCYYPIPKANAFDIYSGQCVVDTYVYYNYPFDNSYLVNVEDGKFLTDKKGQYAIVYRAYDGSGNLSELVVPVHAGRTIEEWEIILSDDIVKNAFVGESIIIPRPQYNGGTGNVTLKCTVSCKDETYTFTTDKDDDWVFRPETVGEWIVTYYLSDYVGDEYSQGYTIKVSNANKPIVKDLPILNPVYIEGFEYDIPSVEVYDTYSGSVKIAKTYVEILDGSGNRIYNFGEKFILKVDNNQDVATFNFKYDYGDGQTYLLYSTEVPVIKAFSTDGKLNAQNLFYSENDWFDFKRSVDGSIFTVKNSDSNWSGNVEWLFSNSLIWNGFSFNFSKNLGAYNKSAVILRFIDSENPDISISAKLFADSKGKANLLFGGKITSLGVDFNENINYEIFASVNKIIINDTAFVTDIDDNGEEFLDFPSGKIYFSLSLENVSVGDEITVREISGHVFANRTVDGIAPIISIMGDYGGSIFNGEEYVLHAGVAVDVICPNTQLYVTVEYPDGSIAMDVDGVTLDSVDGKKEYRILANQIGEYKVIYTASEKNAVRENETTFDYSFFVLDNNTPVITLKSKLPSSVKLGTVVNIPTYEVSDDYSSKNDIVTKIILTNPYGRTDYVTEKSFMCDVLGEYEVRIIVSDEAGNTTMLCYYIQVK